MDGTCIETPEQRGATEDDEPYVFTFYWDVSQNPHVMHATLGLNQTVQRAVHGIGK